jgi:hypothetical protein
MSQTQTLSTPEQSTTTTQEWKAWVNMMPSPDPFKTLHVTGSILAESNKDGYRLAPAEPQGINPAILILEVQPEPARGIEEISLNYTQQVAGPDQYTSIVVRIAGQEDVVIKEIGKAF